MALAVLLLPAAAAASWAESKAAAFGSLRATICLYNSLSSCGGDVDSKPGLLLPNTNDGARVFSQRITSLQQ
jgi:hypothetical protein